MNIAIITGASSGMGKEFAKKLDEENFDELWLVALNEEKLKQTASELKTKSKIFAYDLTLQENLQKITDALKEQKPNVKWLVNASGFGKFGRYDAIPLSESMNMIDLNCKALVYITETTLPYMNDGARIVQFGSIAGFQPVPYINVYSATKAFVVSYSRALNMELKKQKISVTCICPYWTKTQFFKRAVDLENQVVKKYVVMYDAQKVIDKAFADAKKRKELSTYGFKAVSQRRLVKFMPHKLVMKIWMHQQKLK